MRACRNCQFYVPVTDTVGRCRRYPPRQFRDNAPWAAVFHTEWCGEFLVSAEAVPERAKPGGMEPQSEAAANISTGAPTPAQRDGMNA